jgi:hypothetical protein
MNRVITATFTDSIDGDTLRLDPIRVGRVPVTLRTPDRYVTVVKDDEPVLRIDVYAYGWDPPGGWKPFAIAVVVERLHGNQFAQEEGAEQARCSEPGDGAPVDN